EAEDPALHHLSGVALRDAARDRLARDRDDQGGVARAARVFPARGQAGRGAAPGAAHALRSGNDAGNRLYQGNRELLAPPVRSQTGRTATDTGRLLAAGCADVPG